MTLASMLVIARLEIVGWVRGGSIEDRAPICDSARRLRVFAAA
jgi:hypothetical protein